MKITVQGSTALYTVEQLCQMLLPSLEGTCSCRVSRRGGMVYAACHMDTASGSTSASSRHKLTEDEHTNVNLERRTLARAVYRAALVHLGKEPAWGMLSGVRPAKLVRAHLERGGTQQGATTFLEREYFVSPQKSALCAKAGKIAADVHKSLQKGDFSLYAHIPFCPSRCTYCSFISAAGDAFRRWGGDYLQCLLEELAMLRRFREEHAMRARSVYIGGGTPAVYAPAELLRLCKAIQDTCGKTPEEFTVEAGRPDAITAEKLAALRFGGVTRVCVNPQTMNDQTLRLIGRAHTAEDTLRAFHLAREAGFREINCDLIAGLPGEDAADFHRSLNRVLSLDPENITVHTLARKRGSTFHELQEESTPPEVITEMLADAESLLTAAGYSPYYLYRQKYTGGGFENIGWAKPGHICLYNVSMMEEIGDIFSAGAGAVTKLTSGQFTRFTNPKYPAEYIASTDRLEARSRELCAYYQDYSVY